MTSLTPSNNHRQKTDESIGLLISVLIIAYIWPYRHMSIFTKTKIIIMIVLFIVVILIAGILILTNKKNRIKVIERKGLKPQLWHKMSGKDFEDQVVIWLKIVGFKQVTKTEYFDQGIDIIAAKPGKLFGVQVKRSSKAVGVTAVRAAVTGLASYGCSQAMVITNSHFTPASIKLAEVNNCRLVNGEDLIKTKTL